MDAWHNVIDKSKELLQVLPLGLLCGLCGIILRGVCTWKDFCIELLCVVVVSILSSHIAAACGIESQNAISAIVGVSSLFAVYIIRGFQVLLQQFAADPLKTVSRARKCVKGENDEG